MNLHALFAQTPETQTKVASEPSAPRAPAPATSSAVQAAVAEALAPAQTKVASEVPTPASALTKLASEVNSLEKQARIQEAGLIGRAICDGFMSQLAVYEKVAAQSEGTALQEKQAYEAEYARGYAETEAQIQKLASEHYLHGYELARAALS